MEQALRARSLSSASARRKRIQEREGERLKARNEARQRVLALQDLSDRESESGSDDETPESNHSREDSVETCSEYSLNTPDDTPHSMNQKTPPMAAITKPSLHVVVPETPVDGKQQDIPSSEPAPKLHASLATFSDFHYDRFSMIAESPVELELIPSPVSDSDAQESLCEIATPVSFRQPRGRPAVVSITTRSWGNRNRMSSPASSLLHQATQRSSTMPPDLPARSPRRLSQSSQKSGFLASEAAPFEVPELPRNAMYMIANASRDSLAISTHSAEPSTRPHHPRKHSMPLLSAAFKSGHARMSSIKGLVSPPMSARPISRSDRPLTAAADEMAFETVPSDLNEPPPQSRNRSSHRPSTSHASFSYASVRSGSVTALPTPPAEPRTHLPEQRQSRENSPSPDAYVPRKKSFSNLRKRSESISNAIKFVSGSKKGSRDSRLPPTPTVAPPMPTNMRKSVDLRHFPSPPPPVPSPRDQLRKSVTNANYSPFPNGYAGNKGMVGLGIRT